MKHQKALAQQILQLMKKSHEPKVVVAESSITAGEQKVVGAGRYLINTKDNVYYYYYYCITWA